MRLHHFILSVVCWIAWGTVLPALAGPCYRDTFLVLGTSGDRGRGASDGTGAAPSELLLTQQQVLDLPLNSIVTATDWTPASRFEGPLLKDVVALVAASGTRLDVRALNDYAASIPWEDMVQFNPILAYKQNGQQMTRDRFGPLFIVYPRDSHPALRSPLFSARMVWQVCRIDVQ
jgi:hypothetical protein